MSIIFYHLSLSKEETPRNPLPVSAKITLIEGSVVVHNPLSPKFNVAAKRGRHECKGLRNKRSSHVGFRSPGWSHLVNIAIRGLGGSSQPNSGMSVIFADTGLVFWKKCNSRYVFDDHSNACCRLHVGHATRQTLQSSVFNP